MKNFYKLLFALMTILICTSFASTAVASEYDNITSDEIDIKNTIKSYFDFQHAIMSKLDITCFSTLIRNGNDMFVADSYADKFSTVMQMAVAHKSAQIVDLTYDRYNICIEYRRIDINGNYALANVFLVEQIYLDRKSVV